MRLIGAKIFFVVFCLICRTAIADEVTPVMDRAYESYKDLLPFLIDPDAFENSDNEKKVGGLIQDLHDNFHKAGAVSTKYRKDPGFLFSVELLTETLEDASRRFKENKKSYAYWRLRHVSQRCMSCHVTYNVELQFAGTDESLKAFSDFEKADFYMATRQIGKAEDSLTSALKDKEFTPNSMEIARRLLILYTRLKVDPALALKKLEENSPNLTLTQDEKDELNTWISSLKRWASEGSNEEPSLRKAKSLIKDATTLKDPLFDHTDAIGLLRATSILNKLIMNKDLPKADRAASLYLLGYSYSRLPLFFIDEYPEFYLEECIVEYPGSKEAIQSYKLLKEILTEYYSGSSGIHLPGDVAAKIRELHEKAYGIPQLNGRV